MIGEQPSRLPEQKGLADRSHPAASENLPVRAVPEAAAELEAGLPGGGQGRVDVTGIVPEDIHVDPDITEGHPGYEESGSSGIIPPARPA